MTTAPKTRSAQIYGYIKKLFRSLSEPLCSVSIDGDVNRHGLRLFADARACNIIVLLAMSLLNFNARLASIIKHSLFDSSSQASRSNTGQRLVAEPWYIDHITAAEDSKINFSGWALPDPNVPHDNQKLRFSVNGEPPENVAYPQPRPDVQKVFWQRAGADQSGFSFTTKAKYPDGVMKITCADSATTKFTRGRESWFLPDPALHQNLPDADRRFRVIGNRDADGFLRLGATDAYRIKAAFEAATDLRWNDQTAVLDWGVGCGRVARHLAPGLGAAFFGCDIDADNVAWCNANLPGSYVASRLEPPLPYADGTFDVIYGVSVFTHLRDEWELRWLKELHRVLKPGGTMLVTVHGQTAIDFAALDPATYKILMDRVEAEGLVVTSVNNQLDGFVEHPEEYVNVFHSVSHVKKVWGPFFAKIELLPGYIFTHDLVVATKAR